jgi:hypothetical protein
MRFTRDRAGLRDRQGRTLAFLGGAHPLVRRAIAHAQQAGSALCDIRVSAARMDADEPPAVLVTYSAELRCATHVELRWIFAVLLPMDGSPTELTEPKQWLRLGEADRKIEVGDVWRRWFAHWVPKRQQGADAVATTAMRRKAADFSATRCARVDRAVRDLQHWLHRRADSICGAHAQRMDDLFGADPSEPAWRSLSSPLSRLAAYAADSFNSPTSRREADQTVAQFQRREKELATLAALSVPQLRPIGMLMLVPPGFAG